MNEPQRSHEALRNELVHRFVDGAPPAAGEPPPPVSDELDRLLFLFAADSLSAEDDARLWELVAREPGGRRHLAMTLEALDAEPESSRATLDDLVARAARGASPHRAAAPTTSAGAAWSTLPGALVDVFLRIARDHLLAPPGSDLRIGPLALVPRGSPHERPTTLVKQVVNVLGIFEFTFNHRGATRCDMLVHVVQTVGSHPPSSQRATLEDHAGRTLASESLAAGAARFRDLPPGDYRLTIAVDGRPPCAYAVRLAGADEERPDA